MTGWVGSCSSQCMTGRCVIALLHRLHDNGGRGAAPNGSSGSGDGARRVKIGSSVLSHRAAERVVVEYGSLPSPPGPRLLDVRSAACGWNRGPDGALLWYGCLERKKTPRPGWFG